MLFEIISPLNVIIARDLKYFSTEIFFSKTVDLYSKNCKNYNGEYPWYLAPSQPSDKNSENVRETER